VFSHVECVQNRLGEPDSSGRRRPVPIPGSELTLELDTLIVAISEDSGVDSITPARSSGIDVTDWNTVQADDRTLATSRPGVFAAGDVVTGPNTIIQAVAAGKRAAAMIHQYVQGLELEPLVLRQMPTEYLPPVEVDSEEMAGERVETPRASVDWRRRNFAEVEVGLSVAEATREARRCLRCDLEFTRPEDEETAAASTGGVQ